MSRPGRDGSVVFKGSEFFLFHRNGLRLGLFVAIDQEGENSEGEVGSDGGEVEIGMKSHHQLIARGLPWASMHRSVCGGVFDRSAVMVRSPFSADTWRWSFGTPGRATRREISSSRFSTR